MTRARNSFAAIFAALAAVGAPQASAAAELPSAREIERETARFLAANRADPAPRRGSGGVATASRKQVLPTSRAVALYGAPQMGATILGRTSPEGAAARLESQSQAYAELGERPVVGAFDLVSVFATAGGGPDGLYRTRQDPDVIDIYLEQARAVGARLILDIQPGRSTFRKEIRPLKPWLVQPDVDLALDPEWNVGRRGIPGRTQGKVGARQVNRVIGRLDQIIVRHRLPPKLLLVHQFRAGSVRGRTRIEPSPQVQAVLNFDGIGTPDAKRRGYRALSVPSLFNGFSVFYRRDRPRMSPTSVLALEPVPDFVLYQ